MSEEFGFRAIINTSDAETIKAIDGISNAFNNEAYDTLQEVLGSGTCQPHLNQLSNN